uniref:Plasmolipin n=2 Tax=Canis lupus familiaris TaxID=9615 RepID=A0A8P0NPI5_CANLF
MAEFPSKVSTRTSSPAQGAGASVSALRPDLGFVRSSLGALMLLQLVLGLLVWALIADTPYHLYPAYGWVMFVAVFLWLVTIVFFILYLFQLHMKLYMVPWPLLMIFNVGATVLYITAFITCSAAVELTSLKGTRPYNQLLFVFSDDCLRSERFLQLPGLAGSGQQRGHQSDGRWLRLEHCAMAHRGAEGCSRVMVWGDLQV